jgi:hypothetical protein
MNPVVPELSDGGGGNPLLIAVSNSMVDGKILFFETFFA